MSNKFLARDLIQHHPLALYNILPERFILQFDDGEVRTTRRRTVGSAFFWDYHRSFPLIAMLKSHHLQHFLDKGFYNSSTHLDICEEIEKEVYAKYGIGDPHIVGAVSKIAYDSSIEMSNALMPKHAEYVAPLDILDAIQIQRHPKIQEALEKITDHESTIAEAYRVSGKVIMEDEFLVENGLAFGYRANTVKREQVLQSVVCRGIPTDPDGTLFRLPVKTGYLEGMSKIYDFAADSRSAPKAQMSAEAPLQDSEYMARRLQFLVSVVRSIEGEDCGSQELLDWRVDPEEFDEYGQIKSKGGIKAMAGKFVILPGDDKLTELTGNEKELNGRYVRMRSVLTCKNEDKHTVCRTCFGGLSRNYYPHQNLGHLCTVTITERITQNTLSTKHLVGSGRGVAIVLSAVNQRYFKVGHTGTDYLLQEYLGMIQPKITINRDEAMNLLDIMNMKDISDLKVSLVSSISQVYVSYRERGKDLGDILDVQQGGRNANMTLDFIEYIRANGYNIDSENNFEIDLKDWDFSKSILSVPKTEISYSEYGKEVGRMIESNMSQIDERQNPDSPLNTLQELFTLINSKLDIPLSCIEVIVYASMVPSKNNPAMARGWEKPVLGVARPTIYFRSLSCAYAFQGHADFMLSARSFFPHFRPDNQMDVFFAPREVVAEVLSRTWDGTSLKTGSTGLV